jgi:hypothetical protein
VGTIQPVNSVVANYNRNIAGSPTPAGRALISNGLFTQAELQFLGGVMPLVNAAPANQASEGWLRRAAAQQPSRRIGFMGYLAWGRHE